MDLYQQCCSNFVGSMVRIHHPIYWADIFKKKRAAFVQIPTAIEYHLRYTTVILISFMYDAT